MNTNAGGSYIVDKNGNKKKIAGTRDHPKGNRGRQADGTELRKSKNTALDEVAPGDKPQATQEPAPEATSKPTKKV